MAINKQTLLNFIKENHLDGISDEQSASELVRFFATDGQEIEITKDVALDKNLLISIFKNFPNSKVIILSGYDDKQLYPNFKELYTSEELKILEENVNYVRQHFHRDITFDEGFSVEQAIIASRKINNVVRDITEARIDGKPLSNYEKFLWAYQFVTNRVYTEEDTNQDPSISRNLVSVLSSDKIVCVGFASMLCTILTRLGIPCAYQSEISFDPSANIYVNHATCAIRIDDAKYNKHGIYYSDPTADSAPVKRNIYGLTSFNNSLLLYKDLPNIFEHQNFLDSVITSLVKTDDPEEIRATAIHSPKILAKLFPEKTGGKTQDKLIKESAKAEIESANILELATLKLDTLSIETIAKDYSEKMKNLLKVPMLVSMTGYGNFDQYIRTNINALAMNGLTKEEITALIKSTYTAEAIEEYMISSHQKKYPNSTPEMETKLKKDIKTIISKLTKFDKIIETFNFEKVKPIEPESLIRKLAERVAKGSITHSLFGEDDYFTADDIMVLLKQGFAYDDIIVAIKNELLKVDLVSAYLEEYPENISMYAATNEDEIYFTQADPERIYNKPYEEAFEKLTASATRFENEDIFKAFINIYMSQGHGYNFAQDLACLTLGRTNLALPEKA